MWKIIVIFGVLWFPVEDLDTKQECLDTLHEIHQHNNTRPSIDKVIAYCQKEEMP